MNQSGKNMGNLRTVNNNSNTSTKENSMPPKGHKIGVGGGNTSDWYLLINKNWEIM